MRVSIGRKYIYSLLSAVFLASVAYAATQIYIEPSITLNAGFSAHKPKIQRMGDGRLVTVYGDNTVGAGGVYDLKGQKERAARDIYMRSCVPSETVTCNNPDDWSAPLNLSNSALLSSIRAAWKANDPVVYKYPGDIDKPNIKTTGPVILVTWVSKYCPDGDISTLGVVDGTSQQRAVKYLERDGRTIPFSCTWLAVSTDMGKTFKPAIQLSTGFRDAKQDVNAGAYSSTSKKGQRVISWQEDPQGLLLGEAEGPGDGGSGANVNGGTDVWYTYASVDLSVPSTPSDDFVLQQPLRVTDNFNGEYGINTSLNLIYDNTGVNVDVATVETGKAGASRPNIGMVGNTTIIAYEESKGSAGLASGKFIRYHAFNYSGAIVPSAGCVISNPEKNARRVRFLTQSPTDAGAGGTQIAVFWKEGIYDKGGPSDIVVRRGIDGLQPVNMLPVVDAANCATSVYEDVIMLANIPADNISSNTPSATTANLTDDTEENDTENAIAHRGVLRGKDLWIGYNYTSDLDDLWAGLDNYNFWVRQMDVTIGEWGNPENLSNITDNSINVREPRFVGTPKSSSSACPSGDPLAADTTDATLCQDVNLIWVAWGTQTNVPPSDPDGGQDLGEYITASTDAGMNFQLPIQLSEAQGVIWDDDESAYEAQIVLRPDGRRFYAVWNQKNLADGKTFEQYTSGDLEGFSEPEPEPEPEPDPDPVDQHHNNNNSGAFPLSISVLLGLFALIRRRNIC